MNRGTLRRYFYYQILLLSTIILSPSAYGSETFQSKETIQSKWIWYPGDFEVWLHTEVGGRRQERGQHYPPFWRVDSPYGIVGFEKTYDIAKPETISVFADGRYNIKIDGKFVYDFDPMKIVLPAGRHSLHFLVENFKTFPSLLVQSKTVFTDDSWRVTNQNKVFYSAASGKFSKSDLPPSKFHLDYRPIKGEIIKEGQNSMLVDFGRETFGKVIAEKAKGHGKLRLFYGESMQEALAETNAETYDYLDVNTTFPVNDTTAAHAFRYIYAVCDSTVSFKKISALYEFLPEKNRGDFSCSDSLLNRIYDVSLYTLHLNTREFFLDGIKRDRWVWSGDAYQSYLMNFYTFFDEDVNNRTLYALRGHDPVETHINTILDYSFYWMIGVYDNYFYTGDTAFIRQIYPRMKTLMEFCLKRANPDGFVEGLPGDWVFIDWANMDKKGEVSFEELLLSRSLEALTLAATLSNDMKYAEECRIKAKEIRQKVFDVFWSEKKGAFLHSRKNGILSDNVTRYANMFAILFGYVDEKKEKEIKENVILNDNILKITTPYMKFYELASLCEIGEKEKAIDFVRAYWGGMLKLGATTFWEAYDPEQKGDEHYAMYGRPFGKSLCHAWGANPVYLFGKYLLGVKPTAPGYKSYLIEPSLAGLDWIKGRVPTPDGNIEVYMNKKEIRVKTVQGSGVLMIKSKKEPEVENGVSIVKRGDNQYEIKLEVPQKEYTVRYWPIK